MRVVLAALRALKHGMTTFGADIATLVNSIFLTIVYLLGVGITAMVARLFRKRFLTLTPQGKTYWHTIDTQPDDDSYYKQF